MNPHHPLHDYLAGDLAGDELATFITHIASCSRCRDAVTDDRRGSALISSATTSVSELETARLVTALRNAAIPTVRRDHRHIVVAAAAVLVMVVGVAAISRWTTGDTPRHTSASVVSDLVGDTAASTGGVTTRTLIVDGHTVVVAESAHPFPMPPDGSAVATSTSEVWLVQRDGINVVCQNGPTSRLVASSLPAAQLVDLVASGQLG